MKKICFITTVSATLNAFVLNTAKYIHENTDWDITFICDYDREFEEELPDYIHYIPVNMKRGISMSGIKAVAEMKRIFRREKFDLIQYSTPNASLYASVAGKIAKIPVRLYCQWGMVFVGFSGIKRLIFKLEEKLVCKLSTWIEPDSISNLDFAHEQGLYPENKGSVIWNGSASGVNLEKFDISQKSNYCKVIRSRYGIPEDAFVYGFVGRITRDKGINELLSAYKQLLPDNTYLMLVGSEEIDDNIDMDLFNWSKESENVIYTGRTNAVEQYLSAMDVYILPSYREGFGSGVIEAEAMGLPVIVSNIPGPTDAMLKYKTGLVVEKADVKSLAEAMNTIYSNRELYQSLASAAHGFAEEHFEQGKLFEYIIEDRKKLLGENKRWQVLTKSY
ncbi:MAG: glycosyltransferase [Candidatus Avispirillum sp.]